MHMVHVGRGLMTESRMSLLDLAAALNFPVASFDPTLIYRRHLAGRRLVYLDTSVWIELADGKTEAARRLLEACRRVHASRGVVFPLSYPSITELLEQENEVNRRRQARIMDELSEGVALRLRDEIIKEEAAASLPAFFGRAAQPVGRERAFTYALGYLGGAHEAIATMFAELGHPKARSVERIMETLPLAQIQDRHNAIKRDHLARGGAARVRKHAESERGPDGKLKRDRILLRERLSVFEANLYPRIKELSLAAVSNPPGLVPVKPPEEWAAAVAWFAMVFRAMPSCDLHTEVMAERVANTAQKEKATDLLDNEHARVAPAYCDAFVTRDGGLRHLLNSCRVPKERGCQILEPNGLEGFLGG